MATITLICDSVGANRIVPTIAIPYPVGDPTLSKEAEHTLKKNLVKKALEALRTEITEQTHFE